MMKKIISCLLAASMMLAFASCADTNTNSSSTSGTKASDTTSDTTATTETTAATETTADTTETTADTTENTTKAPTPTVDPTTIFDENNIVLSFAAISDTQHQYSGIDTLGKFKNALRQLVSYADETADGLDAVFFVGDLVQSAKTKEVQEFKAAYEEVIDVTEIPLIFSLGNHDVNCHAGYTYEDLTMESFYSIFGDAYRTYDKETSDLSIGCTHTVVNNYHFICINPIDDAYIGYDDGGVLYSAEAKAWLDKTLASITAENPDHYVFVNTHPMVYDTTYGSTLLTGNHRWYTKDLTSILEKYNQVVTFGGHVHFPLNDPRSIMQDTFTSLGCASVTYMAIENGGYENMSSATVMRDCAEYSQGLLVQVDKNGNARITRMDFYNGGTIGENWIISHPATDNSHLKAYGKDRGSEENNAAPTVEEAKLVIETAKQANKMSVTMNFDAAIDDEFAHHYVIKLTNKDTGTVMRTVKILSDFYRHGNPEDMADTYSQKLGNLTVGTTYEIAFQAIDSWDAVYETAIEFKLEDQATEIVFPK